MELQLHAPGAQGLQNNGGIFRTEEKRRVGRAFLYDLQQHVLILLCQNGAVRENIYLPGAFVGADIGVRPNLADGIHGEIFVLLVPDGDDIGMDAGENLAAGGTHAAWLLPTLTFHGCRGIPGGGCQIAAAGKQQGVGQRPPAGGFPDAPGNGVTGKIHQATSFAPVTIHQGL